MGQELLWIHIAIMVLMLDSSNCHNKEEIVTSIWRVYCYLYATQLEFAGKQGSANKLKKASLRFLELLTFHLFIIGNFFLKDIHLHRDGLVLKTC